MPIEPEYPSSLDEVTKQNLKYLKTLNENLKGNKSPHWEIWKNKYQSYYLDLLSKARITTLSVGQLSFISVMANDLFSREKVYDCFGGKGFSKWFEENTERCKERWEACLGYYNFSLGAGNKSANWSLCAQYPNARSIFSKTQLWDASSNKYFIRPPQNYSDYLYICHNKWSNRVWRVYLEPPKFEEGQLVRVYRPNNFNKNRKYYASQDKTKITTEDVIVLDNKDQTIQSVSKGSRPYLVISPKTKKQFVVKEKYLYDTKDIGT